VATHLRLKLRKKFALNKICWFGKTWLAYANGTYLATVVDANEYALSTAGIYTVVRVSADGEYSALHSGGRAEFDTSTSISIGAIDAPANIRLERNLLVWGEVSDASTYDIYLLSSVGPNANGTYLTTVVDANEYALNTEGIYTVVSVSANGVLSSVGPNANGTYLATVVDANEYTLSTAGIYTVVSVASNIDYSALHSGGRVNYDTSINVVDTP